MCVLTAPLTDCSSLSLRLLQPAYALSLNIIEIKQIKNLKGPLSVKWKDISYISHFRSKARND